MENEKEIPQLRALYDELWHDAKTLIRDMKESISMYLFSGVLLLLFTWVTFYSALGHFSKILAGNADLLAYFNASVALLGMVFFILYGVRLIRFYYKLRERYGKLLEMEKKIED